MNTSMHGASFFSFHFLSSSIPFPKLTIFTILRLYLACKIWKITVLTWEISSWVLEEKFHISTFPMYYSLFNWIGGNEITKLKKIYIYLLRIQKKDTKTSTRKHELNRMTQNGLLDVFRNAHAWTSSICTSSHHVPYEKQEELNKGSEPWSECPC